MRTSQKAELLVPNLYDYQREILDFNKTELIINKSRQVGISYCVACKGLLEAIGDKKTALIISPSMRQSKHMMGYIYEFYNRFKTIVDNIDVNIREETKTSIIFNGGGEIHSLPNSANTVRGYRADSIYIDEFAHFTNSTDREVIEALAPSVSRGGDITYISTPFGDQNLFYEYWHNGRMEKLLINYKQCSDFQETNIETIRRTIGEDAFQQEYNNQFLSDIEGQEFPFELISRCVDHELEYSDLNTESKYMGGADIGRERDLTAFIALEKGDDLFTVRNKKTMRQTEYNKQLDFFKHILKNYRFDKFFIDESGIGNMLAEELAREHRINRITFNNENKQEMVGNLKRIMQEGKLRFPNDPQLINSIRAIKRIYTPSNYLKFEAERTPEIGHADLFWALALSLYGESTRKPFFMPVHE